MFQLAFSALVLVFSFSSFADSETTTQKKEKDVIVRTVKKNPNSQKAGDLKAVDSARTSTKTKGRKKIKTGKMARKNQFKNRRKTKLRSASPEEKISTVEGGKSGRAKRNKKSSTLDQNSNDHGKYADN